MTADAMISEIIKCFVPPQSAMIEKMKQLAESIEEGARAEVIQEIIENETPATKIGASHIIAACNKLQVSYRKAHYVPAHSWECDACGYVFQYTPCACDDDKIDKNIHDCCPMCGFQPAWAIMARGYDEVQAEWYKSLIAKCAAHRREENPVAFMDGSNIYFNRAKAEEDRRKERRLAIDKRVSEMVDAKRWDLKNE